MNTEQFKAIQSIDDDIRDAMIEVYGRPPDDFIDDAQGGGVDSEALSHEDPAADQALIDALDKELADMGADVADSGHVRYD